MTISEVNIIETFEMPYENNEYTKYNPLHKELGITLTTNVKYEKKAKYVYFPPCLPAVGRPGVKVKNMQDITKYVEYAEYGLAL